MRPSRPQIHPQSTANPPPQQFNPRFPSPQNPNFNNCGPGGPPLPNLNQVVAAAALQLLQQQSNPQFPVNQAQNNNLAAALVQMAGMLGGEHSMPGPQMGQLNGNPVPSSQMPQQQQSAGFQYPPAPQQQQSAGFQCPPTPQEQQQPAGFQCPPTPHQQQPVGFQYPPTPQQQQPAGFQRPPTPQLQQSVRPQVYSQNQLMNGNLVRPFQAPRPTQQHQHHATNAMNQQFNSQTNGNHVLHQPPSQQQHHLTSSMHTFNVPPSSQSGIMGSPQNPGNPMVLNGASQWNNQVPGRFAAPSSNGLGALQENPMVPQNSQPLTFPMGDQQFYPQTNGNQVLHHQLPPSQWQQHHLTSSMHTFNVPPSSQSCILGSPHNSGNPMVLNGASQWNNQGPGRFAAPSSNGPGALQENPMVPQNSQPLTFPMGDQPPWMNGNGLWRPQVNHVSDLSQLAPSVMNKHFGGKVPGYEKGVQSNMRFQNHTSYVKNAKGNMGPSTKNGGQGRQQLKQKKQLNYSCEEPKRKYPRITYSEREVSEWRKARKKNYPTTDPIIKKLRKGGKFARRLIKRKWENDEDAKLHRQQLKEILAKQKELEVNICEIPKEYLSEPEKKNNVPKKKNDKRRAFTSKVVSAKRAPTLLQKLLGPEKLRDKSYLLQVFRFMALNNFFDQSPDEPFKFPVVKREGADKDDAENEDDDDSDVEGEEKEEEEAEKEEEDNEEAVEENLSSKDSEKKVDSDKTEEGEITD